MLTAQNDPAGLCQNNSCLPDESCHRDIGQLFRCHLFPCFIPGEKEGAAQFE